MPITLVSKATTMKKTFTVLSVTHTPVSPERGSMTWFLSDELHHSRKVNAVTTLDKQGHISHARPVYARETPLIEALMQHEEGDTFSIDFQSFNEEMGYLKRDVFADMQKLEQASKLSSQVNRFLVVLLVLVMTWLGWLTVQSFYNFAQHQPQRIQ